MSLNKLYDTDKDNTLDKEPTSSETSENKQSNKPKKRKIIPNMVVEEDQINLSDLGNGPEKPKIKTIVKKMMSKKEKGTEEPTPSKTVKTYLKSPESSKSNSTVKKTPISSKKQKSQGSIKEVQNFSPDDSASEYMKSSADLDYHPVSEFVDYKELSAHPNFKIKKYKDAIYRGMIDPETHQRQGIGIMEYITGRIYEGAWNKDLREGEGYERYANNNIYKGNFLRGKAHGQGNYQWANGEYYNGEWNQGQKHGYGEWKSHDGDSYEGEWKEGKADGQGVYAWKNGDRYDGDWLVCLKHGKGTDYFANGDSYTGQYKYGKPWGTGIYTWRNGSAYKGQFKNGLKHGKGKWTKGEGDEKCVFEGNYVKGKKQGYGEFKWASGNFYRGEYKGDERHGYGEMYWNDDSFYKGAWVNGIQHGQGIMQLADGTVKKGTFENNIFIEEVMEECESVESSAMEEYDESPQNVVSQKINKKKGKKKRNRDEPSLLPSIASQNTIPTKSGRKFSSAQKSLARNLSDANIRKGGIIQFNSARRFRNSSKKRGKNSLSLPKIGSANQESAVSSRLKGFTSVAKNQAKERKKLESYFKSLDKAVQILRDKKQHELANRPWIPAGPVQQYQYRPSSKYG
ncbi:unnamed protein product [Moneuplotes crassus]|uniref:Uncharacterized protein n=1 Tax=Euplotes crassus TaxID=5936 RepID=A0AAD1Y5N1_EUPCR|nr:unnamed protein product [Moneuplotes crassus]